MGRFTRSCGLLLCVLVGCYPKSLLRRTGLVMLSVASAPSGAECLLLKPDLPNTHLADVFPGRSGYKEHKLSQLP